MSSDPDTPAMIDGGRLVLSAGANGTSTIDFDTGVITVECMAPTEEDRAAHRSLRERRVASLRKDYTRHAANFRKLSELALIAAEAADALAGELSLDTLDYLGFDFARSPDGRHDPFQHYEWDRGWDYGWHASGDLAAALVEILRDQTLAGLARHLTEEAGPLATVAAKARAESGVAPQAGEDDE